MPVMPEQVLYAGIDLGTSGCRLVVIDEKKQIQTNSSIRYKTSSSDLLEQTPELWWQSVTKLLADLPDEIKNCLKSLAIDGTSGTLLLTDQHGNPTTQALMYNDLRATQEAVEIKQVLPKESGAQGVSGSLSRLLWLLKNQPSSQHAYALHQADFLLNKLSNQFEQGCVVSDENNCLKLGYDIINRHWPDEMEGFGFPLSLLPKVVPAGKWVSTIDSEMATQLGLPSTLKLVTGTTDSIAAFIATGADQIGDGVTSLGSTLVIKLMSDKPVFAPEYGVYSHRLNLAEKNNTWLVGGASNSGGNVLLEFFNQQQLDEMTPKLHPEHLNNYNYYPLVKQGERFPFADSKKEPQLTPRPSSDVEFMQGILEGIADIEALAYQRLAELGTPEVRVIRTAGGGSKNEAWSQIRQIKLGVEMVDLSLPHEYSEAAYGSAILARSGCKSTSSLD